MANRAVSMVSAQWSNDEIVHQVLVELLNADGNVDTSELLRKVKLTQVWRWLIIGSY